MPTIRRRMGKVGERHSGWPTTWKDKRDHIGARAPTSILRSADAIWLPADGQENFPDGEIFTGPIETANGAHLLQLPGDHGGRESRASGSSSRTARSSTRPPQERGLPDQDARHRPGGSRPRRDRHRHELRDHRLHGRRPSSTRRSAARSTPPSAPRTPRPAATTSRPALGHGLRPPPGRPHHRRRRPPARGWQASRLERSYPAQWALVTLSGRRPCLGGFWPPGTSFYRLAGMAETSFPLFAAPIEQVKGRGADLSRSAGWPKPWTNVVWADGNLDSEAPVHRGGAGASRGQAGGPLCGGGRDSCWTSSLSR